MTNYRTHAAKVLTATFALSFGYELYRATVRSGATPHDSMRGLVEQLPLYAIAAAVIGLLFAGYRYAERIGLVFCTAVIAISIGYYNPEIMLEREPGLFDWFEDLVFTGLLFVAATQLIYQLRATRARPGTTGRSRPDPLALERERV
jgi:hypothetical protein